MITRRQFAASTPLLMAGSLALAGCSQEPASDGYEAVAERIWQPGRLTNLSGAAIGRELVRCATLAPSSHNTQCWQFALEADGRSISILPDLARRCPAVDPDDHHLFVSLGCATENLIQAALAHGLQGEARFDAIGHAGRVTLEPTRAQTTPLFTAIPARQCTRGDYDGKPLSSEQLALLQRDGRTDAVRTRDGLYSVSSGNPNIPSWIGDVAFRWLLTARGENDKVARQARSSAGIAVFAGQTADRAHWVEVGRCYERFALQAAAMGLSGQRPDLVVRFGCGPAMPHSLRRPVDAVLV